MLSDSAFPKVTTLSCFHCINKIEKLKKIDQFYWGTVQNKRVGQIKNNIGVNTIVVVTLYQLNSWQLLIAVSRKQMSVSREQNSFLNVVHYLKHTYFILLNSFWDNFIEMLFDRIYDKVFYFSQTKKNLLLD